MSTDWSSGYGVSFEFWEVDKDTFRDKKRLYEVEECEIVRDSGDETLGSATMTIGDFPSEETYIRVYLLAEQPAGSGEVERVCLGTFLAQVPSVKMDGKIVERPLELSTPLKELADDQPPAGYTVRAGTDAVSALEYIHRRGHVKVVHSTASARVPKDITANDSDSWLSFGTAVLESVNMERTLDPYGYVGFAPVRDAGALQTSWTYADNYESIILPEAELTCDWHNVPNVVEVIVSTSSSLFKVQCVNDDPDSSVSTVRRGRVKRERVMNPEGVATREQAVAYAKSKLRELSCSERELTYTHGYCDVRLGDGVRLYYREHSLDCNLKVTRQVIRCKTDLEVEETGTYTEVLWNG